MTAEQWPCSDAEWAERQAFQVEAMQCRRSDDESSVTAIDALKSARESVRRAEVELREMNACIVDLEMLAIAVLELCDGQCPSISNHPSRTVCWWCVARARAIDARKRWEIKAYLKRRNLAWEECNEEKARQANAS